MSLYTDVLGHLAAAMNVATEMLRDDPDNLNLNDLLDNIGDAQGDAIAWHREQRT